MAPVNRATSKTNNGSRATARRSRVRAVTLSAAVALLAASVTTPALARPGVRAKQTCKAFTYGHHSVGATVVKGSTTCTVARKVMKVVFTGKTGDGAYQLGSYPNDGSITPGDAPTADTITVGVDDDNTWKCPVYRDSKPLKGLTCKKGSQQIHTEATVPRSVYASDLEPDPGSGEGE